MRVMERAPDTAPTTAVEDLAARCVAIALVVYCLAAVDEDVFGAMSFGRVSRIAAVALVGCVCMQVRRTVPTRRSATVNPPMLALYAIATLSLLSMLWSVAPSRSESTSFTLVSVLLATAAAVSAIRSGAPNSRRLVELGLVAGALIAAFA